MSIKVWCSASKPRKPGNLKERANLKSIQAIMDCFLLCKKMFHLSLLWFMLTRNILAGYPPLPAKFVVANSRLGDMVYCFGC